MGEEHRKVERVEVDKLLKANFIREVIFSTWLANVVMVKKKKLMANGEYEHTTPI